ncbi:Papain cysteine protease family protein [Brugia pahangi]
MIILLLLLLWLGRIIIGIGFHDIPGIYCGKRSPTCCPNRNDQCTVAILGNHLCYCDMFCDRGEYGNDCCPDFKAVCRYSQRTLAPDCTHDGITYSEGDTITRNCNQCTCTEKQWKCDYEPCLIDENLLLKIQNGRYTWTARNYSEFWGRTLRDGIRHRLGTLFPEQSVQSMNEMIVKPRELPTSFDARQKWPNFIHPIQDQGECASSWAQSTAATSADRLALITDGRQNVSLSAQQILSCNQHRQKGCEGGYLDRAWWYIRKFGVVSEECYPYVSGITKKPEICEMQKSRHTEGRECPSGHANSRVYRTTPSYRVSSKEKDIMSEILTNGPVQATFLVHGDFFMYSGGVYKHLPAVEEKVEGYHSVRLLGWGEDHSTGIPVKYWIAANSWGLNWGENGTFRILRGENHCEIESFVIGAWGKGFKKRRRLLKLRKIRRHFRML